jgi:DNA-binding MarR family transcriptional regulator
MSGKPYGRGKQIIRELYENGPLTATGLRCLLQPPISKSGVKQALKVLRQKKLIVTSKSSLELYRKYYYQLSLTGNTRPIIGKILNLPPMALHYPVLHNHDMGNSQDCAIWCNWFGRMFPNSVVARDIHYKSDTSFKMPFAIDSVDWKHRPDMLMRIASQDSKREFTFAIDLHKDWMNHGKWMTKMLKLYNSGAVRGVIYFGPFRSVESLFKYIAHEQKYTQSRINKCFRDNFILLGTGAWSNSESAPVMFGSDGFPVSLREWINTRSKTEEEKPLEPVSKTPASCG